MKRNTISKALIDRASQVAQERGVIVEIARADITVKVYPDKETELKPEEW